MKKILIAIFALFLGLQVNAATTENWDSAAAQKKLNNIAYKLIKSVAVTGTILSLLIIYFYLRLFNF